MKTDNVYLVDLITIKNIDVNCSTGTTDADYGFLRKALVYKKRIASYSDKYNYIDLNTGVTYKENPNFLRDGDIIINPNAKKIPINELIKELNSTKNKNVKVKENMSRRKILKIFK